jgi:hypothetical protein
MARLVKMILFNVFVFMMVLSATVPLYSCEKTNTYYDTTYLTVHDTTVVVDSIYDLTSGLVAYYNFTGGSLADSSGYNNNISFNNNATQTADRFGNANNAYLFDGTTSYMSVPNSPTLSPNTLRFTP